MAYAAGQKLRASQMSVYVCTSSTRPSGHSGQIIYETDTGMLAMYTGTSWRYITATGEIASDATYRQGGTAQTINNATDTVARFDVAVQTSPLIVRGTTGPGHYFRMQRPGRHIIASTIRWAQTTATGERYMSINRGGTEVLMANGQIKTNTNDRLTQNCTVVFRVAVGDENTSAADIHVNLYQNSGGDRQLEYAPGWCQIAISWIGP